jgi:hypothetical protein
MPMTGMQALFAFVNRGRALAKEPPQACRECPWRFTNHATRERFGGDAADWTNRQLLTGGGEPTTCHMTGLDPGMSDVPIQQSARSTCCAGTAAIQQRVLVRHLLGDSNGRLANLYTALTRKFFTEPIEDNEAAAAYLLANAHEGVFDPELGCSLAPAPTAAETERWRALQQRDPERRAEKRGGL